MGPRDLVVQMQLYLRADLAEKTLEGYGFDWRCFCRWCGVNDRTALPATEETLSYYLTAALGDGLKVATLCRQVTAITHYHKRSNLPSPVTPRIRAILTGARRLRKETPCQRTALVLDPLQRACAAIGSADARSIRDRAILLFGFATALRRSSIASLGLADVSFDQRGMEVTVKREKNNQHGPARVVAVPFGQHPETCPVIALLYWIDVRGDKPGALFVGFSGGDPSQPSLGVRVSPARIAKIVQDSVQRIGLDPRTYGAHSLRAGFVTEALERGIGELAIARQTGHRSLATLRLYFRSRDPFRGNASGAVGL